MKRRLFALILAIAMLSGVAVIATADETKGSIEFQTGAIIINPPDPPPGDDCFCCPDCHPAGTPPCECDPPNELDPRCPCPCTCPDKDDYDRFFMKHRVANNLYFGEHELIAYGTFDSANKLEDNGTDLKYGNHYTTRTGEYTGVEIINQTPGIATISVAIGHFLVDTEPTLTGFELRLIPEAAILRDSTVEPAGGVPITPGPNFRGGSGEPVVLKAGENATSVLIVGSAREVKAAWYGLLDIGISVPRRPGEAQAILTWTGVSAPP